MNFQAERINCGIRARSRVRIGTNLPLQEGTTAARGSHGLSQGCGWMPVIRVVFFSGSSGRLNPFLCVNSALASSGGQAEQRDGIPAAALTNVHARQVTRVSSVGTG